MDLNSTPEMFMSNRQLRFSKTETTLWLLPGDSVPCLNYYHNAELFKYSQIKGDRE